MVFPQDVKVREERRRFQRISFREAVQFSLEARHGFGGCLAQDISEGGLKIHFEDFVPINKDISFKLRLGTKPGARIIDVMGKVVWIAMTPYSDRYQLGIQFSPTDSYVHAQQEIYEYVTTQTA